jgi:hypothetical protein
VVGSLTPTVPAIVRRPVDRRALVGWRPFERAGDMAGSLSVWGLIAVATGQPQRAGRSALAILAPRDMMPAAER